MTPTAKRQQAFRDRRTASGYKHLCVWLSPKAAQQLQETVSVTNLNASQCIELLLGVPPHGTTNK